ncbi:MAG: YggS family pyridoxal phosphate-dependent enzyme [Deltaproteobacteria bacterium]|nr:MAG: YggS family pyridoxal phosphate-dependent enzyme [Deltaproteobacteria bacterium]
MILSGFKDSDDRKSESILKQIISEIMNRVSRAASSRNRKPESIRIVAVTKTVPAEKIREAVTSGISVIGESYIQEARNKYDLISEIPVSWHFIGHLQTNKVKYAVTIFDLIHTVDSVRLAAEIDHQAGKLNKTQDVLLQINIGREETKSGMDEEDLPDIIKEIARFKNISVKGLMVIPPFSDDPEIVRPYFSSLFRLRGKLQDSLASDGIRNVSMDELSMGMSGDFEVAIEEGSTLVRIGTAIFGERK